LPVRLWPLQGINAKNGIRKAKNNRAFHGLEDFV
jgi:hypothetical protein